MPLHRLVTPTYPGGLPVTHDLINDGVVSDAPADGAKGTGDNAGTYYVAFGEDATSLHANRPHEALAQNTDFLDDVVSGALPVPSELEVTAPGGAVLSKQLTGDIFVGRQTEYLDTQVWRDKLCKVVDPATGNELLASDDTPIKVIKITSDAGGITSVVGVPASGFSTDPYVFFTSPGIQSGQDYKLVFAKQGTLEGVVKSKTWLDAFTRFAIAGAPEVSGEVERFLHSASRRSGTAVTALACTTLETPGTGDNVLDKSEALTLDVDPSDDAGSAARSLNFRVGSTAFFSVEELAKGGSYVLLKTPKNDMGFLDARLDANNGPIVLSDTTHNVHRIMDADAAAQPSLLAMINKRWEVTCGDGTNTFGDFNGSTAIEDAIDFFVANAPAGMSSLTLYVKAGNYTFTSSYTLPGNKEIIIIGAGAKSTAITNGIGTATSPSIILPDNSGGGQSSLSVQGVTFGGSSTGEVAIRAGSWLKLADCTFSDQYLVARPEVISFATTKPFLHVVGCTFSSAGLTSAPCVLFTSVTTQFAATGFIFENCVFFSSATGPVLRVSNGGPADVSYYRGVLFNRCVMRLDEGTAAGGNPGANTGVLELDPSTNNNVVVQDIEWRDCRVSVQSGSGDTGLLMYLRTDDGSNYITCSRVAIVGGRWEVEETTVISPFYIGGETYDGTPYVDDVVIENVHMGFSSSSSVDYGDSATEVVGPASQADWAAFYINAADLIRIQSWKFIAATPRSGAGDLYLRGPGRFEVDGVQLSTWINTGGSNTPTYRVQVCGGDGGSGGQVDGVVVDCAGLATNPVCVDYIVQLRPNNGLVVRDCAVHDHDLGTSTPAAFGIPWEGTAEKYGLSLLNCSARNLAGDGFRVYQAAGDLGVLQELIVRGCNFFNCEVGIRVGGDYDGGSGNAVSSVILDGNICYDNDAYGIWVAPGAWQPSAQSILLSGNVCIGNSGANNGVQINIGGDQNSGGQAWGSDATCMLMGNMCGGGGVSDFGSIQFVVNGIGTPPPDTRGTETGYTGFAGGGPIVVGYPSVTDHRTWSPGGVMVHNQAVLLLNDASS